MDFEKVFLFFVRWGLSMLALFGGIVLFFMSRLVKETRLSKHLFVLSLAMSIFFAARAVGAILDYFFVLYSFGVFSTFVTYAYFVWVDCFLFGKLRAMQSDRLGIEGRRRIAANYDEILQDIDSTRQKLITNGS